MKHLRFFRLSIGERLDINSVTYKKVSAFSARHATTGALRRVMPWDKVRSTKPVKIVAPKSEAQKVSEFVDEFCGTGCQGDSDARDSVALALHAFNVISPGKPDASGDRKSETIGGNELTPSS